MSPVTTGRGAILDDAAAAKAAVACGAECLALGQGTGGEQGLRGGAQHLVGKFGQRDQVVGRHVEAVEGLLDDAERAFAVTGDEPHEPSVPRAVSVLANVPAGIAFLHADLARLRGNAARAADYDRQALAQLGEEDWLMRSHVRWNLAVADWLRGQLGPAERDLAEVAAERRAAGGGHLGLEVGHDLGLLQRARGNLDAALATYRQALETSSGQLQGGGGGPANRLLRQAVRGSCGRMACSICWMTISLWPSTQWA